MDGEPWQATVHEAAKSWTQLSMHTQTRRIERRSSLVYTELIQMMKEKTNDPNEVGSNNIDKLEKNRKL